MHFICTSWECCYFVTLLPADCLPVLHDSCLPVRQVCIEQWALQYRATVSHLQMMCYDAAY